MPAKKQTIKQEAAASSYLAPAALPTTTQQQQKARSQKEQNQQEPQDTLAVVTRIFSDVHISSTTHAESKRALLKMLNEGIAFAASNSSNNNNSASSTRPQHTISDIIESMRRVTLAACVTVDTTTMGRHTRFMNQTFGSLPIQPRIVPVLQLLQGLYVHHNSGDDKTRLHVLSTILELIRCLPDLGDNQTPPWFGEFVEILKLRSRDKSWPVREKALHLLTIFNLHDLKDDVTQFMFYIGAEETRTEIRKLLLRYCPAKSVYFAMIIRFLDDKVSSIRKQAWTQFGGYNWMRIEAYGVRNNLVAKVAHGLSDTAKSVQTEVGIALKKWMETKELQEKQKILHQRQQEAAAAAAGGDDDNNNKNNNKDQSLPHYKCSPVELLDMLMIGLRNSFTSTSSAFLNEPDCNPADQPHFISTVADHLFRESEAKTERRRRHRAQLQREIIDQQKQKEKNKENEDADDIPLMIALGGGGANDSANEPLPYPLMMDGMSVANLSMWAAHCRAVVAAGRTDMEEKLLPPLREFAALLSDSIEIFHRQFGADPVDLEEQKNLPESQRGIRSNSKRLRIIHPCEAELILHILIRSFMLYQEAGYLAHIDHESSRGLVDAFRRLLTITMDPPSMFCKEAVEALFAVCGHGDSSNNNNATTGGQSGNNGLPGSSQQTDGGAAAGSSSALSNALQKSNAGRISITEPIRITIERLFNSLSLVRNYGLAMEDSETFGKYDAVRRTQLQEMQRRSDMAEASRVLSDNIGNDDLYMKRMMHITLEYLSARSRTDRSGLPPVIDCVIRLGREWGELDGQVREISIRALGMSCLANPSIVPTYIGLLIHNAAAAVGVNNNNNSRQQQPGGANQQTIAQNQALEAQKKHRHASIAASFDILCEFGAGFFKRQPHQSNNNNAANNNNQDDGDAAAVTNNKNTTAAAASFDVQQWDRYTSTLQSICVDHDGAARRLAVVGVSKMLACNRFQNSDALLCGMALVQLYYVSPTTGDLQALQQQFQQRLISSMRLVQEKCQINHANDAFLFFLKAYSSSTPKRMKQTLDGGLLTLRLLLRRARVSNSALVAATKFIRRLISITDSCSLEQVRDIDPRIAEAAKERILSVSGNSNANNNNNNVQQVQQMLLGTNNAAAADPFDTQNNTLSLPPLQDESGNDLFEVAKSNPVLWTLLASHSQHEILAEFLLESIREGCVNNNKAEDVDAAAEGFSIGGRNSSKNNNNNKRKSSGSPTGGRKSGGAKANTTTKKKNNNDDDDDEDDDKKEEDKDEEDTNSVKKDENSDDDDGETEDDKKDNDANIPADTIACKMLCARSLANLQLYKRDPSSVTRMCENILRTQNAVQEQFPDVATVVNRFGLAYAKSCGRKSLDSAAAGESALSSANTSGRASFNNNNRNSTNSLRNSGGSKKSGNNTMMNSTFRILTNSVGKDGVAGWKKLSSVALNAVESWFYADQQQQQQQGTSSNSNLLNAGGAQRRGRQ